MYKVLCVFGTRPEVIKMAPLVKELEKRSQIEVILCSTGQHRELIAPMIDLFGLRIDIDLDIMKPNQTLAGLTSSTLKEIDQFLEKVKPDLLIVQGDTTTVLSTALCAFYHKIVVAHLEAGLRTNNKFSPFPEEMNRVITSKLADVHFAPTPWAKNNLLCERVSEEKVFVTGNTVIDTLLMVLKMIKKNECEINFRVQEIINGSRDYILITSHRRENFNDGILSICKAILELANEYPELDFVFPVHLNPNIRIPVFKQLDNQKNILLLDPLDYVSFIALMNNAYLILTDSGGVQEEAPSLGKPVLVLRDTTERPEGIEVGTSKLVGTKTEHILNDTRRLINDKSEYEKVASISNPYGDGTAATRIADIIEQNLGTWVQNNMGSK